MSDWAHWEIGPTVGKEAQLASQARHSTLSVLSFSSVSLHCIASYIEEVGSFVRAST
jgi:hypothetical protein